MRVPIYKRLMEARDNPNADLHKLTTDILALFSVVGTSVCDEPDEPVERCKCCKSFHEPDVCCYD
jgi:hypothetical protein